MHLDSTFLGVHLDSTFLGVHLDSTSLGVHLDSKAVQEQQWSTGHGLSRSSREVLGASPRPPGEGSSHMGCPGQQVVARRDPGELERSWRGVLSRWRLVDE